MAWFTYECIDGCGSIKISSIKRAKTTPCPLCQKDCKPVINAGTARVVERLDNGSMGRAVEQLKDIEEIMNKRSDKYDVEQE